MADTKTNAAFQDYLRDPVVQKALKMAAGNLSEDLLRDAFMHGASYGAKRREELATPGSSNV